MDHIHRAKYEAARAVLFWFRFSNYWKQKLQCSHRRRTFISVEICWWLGLSYLAKSVTLDCLSNFFVFFVRYVSNVNWAVIRSPRGKTRILVNSGKFFSNQVLFSVYSVLTRFFSYWAVFVIIYHDWMHATPGANCYFLIDVASVYESNYASDFLVGYLHLHLVYKEIVYFCTFYNTQLVLTIFRTLQCTQCRHTGWIWDAGTGSSSGVESLFQKVDYSNFWCKNWKISWQIVWKAVVVDDTD